MIKTIKKLLVSPIEFFQDSWFLKFHLAEDYRKTTNLFFISQMGQLEQYQGLIEKLKLKNNVLIVLYTKKNQLMPKNIAERCNKELFNSIRFLCLPKSPMRLNIKNYIMMLNSYKLLLKRIKPKELYISSFERHYSLLGTLAKNMGFKVNLVEEGTGTYKYSSMQEACKKLDDSMNYQEKKVYKKISKSFIYKNIRSSLKPFDSFDH
ncbi:TPA: sialyltransferase, partial [Mannheimia haemolytica]|nr:sialyltransferase [Mannheimia haemolytica]HDL3294399.1 sialyltransferase [Mannheimia haemolytica]